MSELAAAGAYCGHLQRYGSRYDLAIDAMTEISRHCGSPDLCLGVMTCAGSTWSSPGTVSR